jgi:SecD/SecF fusion protein
LDVYVFGDGRADIDAVKQRLANFDLEFRILANPSDPAHAAIIQEAQSADESGDEGQVVRADKQAARWVSCPTIERSLGDAGNQQFVTRTDTAADGGQSTEVLVLMVDLDVTGIHVQSASKTVDASGRPAIWIDFTAPGAAAFSRVTGRNVPNEATGLRQRLAIIMNNEITSAPFIHSRIAEQAILEGGFTEVEANAVAAVLDGGTLPVRLELVEERAP